MSQKDSLSILLAKLTEDDNSRIYYDFQSINLLVIGLFEIYEQLLKKKNASAGRLTYSLNDLLEFIDKMADISVLQYDSDLKGFRPHGKDWLKTYIVAKYLS